VKRERDIFVGIDLGGPRGKTTALARLRRGAGDTVLVEEIDTRGPSGEPWHDDALIAYLAELGPETVVAIDAPLTAPSCIRCQLTNCPGVEACVDPAVVWLRTTGAELQARAELADRDRIAAIPASPKFTSAGSGQPGPSRRRLAPYTHRCTEVLHHFQRDLVRREVLSRGPGPVSARAVFLRRVLASHGFELNENLIEVSPRSTVQALFGRRRARGYKRDADPWVTRAAILEELADELEFSPKSRLAKDEVLRNDHCFDALLSGYTAYLWARDGWKLPAGEERLFADDGWIWVPPDKA
jgi:predicted nuclease with RNAse H fold